MRLAVASLALLAGCSHATLFELTERPEAVTVAGPAERRSALEVYDRRPPGPAPADSPAARADESGLRSQATVQSPPATEYAGGGRRVVRVLKVWRICSPFGLSAGEVVSRQQPIEIKEPLAVPLKITAEGIENRAPTTAEAVAGGGTWTLWDTIKSWLRPVLWTAAVVGGALLVLLIIPVTRPGALAILRLIAAAFPLLGSLVEWRIGKKSDTDKQMLR